MHFTDAGPCNCVDDSMMAASSLGKQEHVVPTLVSNDVSKRLCQFSVFFLFPNIIDLSNR